MMRRAWPSVANWCSFKHSSRRIRQRSTGRYGGTYGRAAERSQPHPFRFREGSNVGALVRSTLSIIAAALFVGCEGSQWRIGAAGVIPASGAPGRSHNDYGTTGPLLFVTNFLSWTVTVYHASARDPAPVATISQGLNDPAGACVD